MGSAAAEGTPRTKTAYVVYQQITLGDNQGEAWQQVGASPYQGTTADDAIKAAITALDAETGTFLAVPERSVRPRTISVETRRSVRLG